MLLNLLNRNKSRKLPKQIRQYMAKPLGLSEDYLETLRCFEKDVVIRRKRVKRYLILNPLSAEEDGTPILTRADLDRHPEFMLYESNIDDFGGVQMIDRRSPKNPYRASSGGLPTRNTYKTRWF